MKDHYLVHLIGGFHGILIPRIKKDTILKKKIFGLLLTSLLFAGTLMSQTTLDPALSKMKANQWGDAKVLLEKHLEESNEDARAYYLLGRCLLAQKEYDKASDNFEEAVNFSPDSAKYNFWLGQAYSIKAQNSGILTQAWLAPKIKNAFERTIELDSTQVQARISLANYYLMAPGFMGGSIDKAYEQARKITELGDINGKFLLASIYQKEEKADSASQVYEELENKIGNDSTYYYFYNSYGYFLMGQEKYDQAIEKFKKQVELAPKNNANPYDSLGDAYLAAGKKEEAKEQFKIAIRINPDFEISRKKLEELSEE